MSELKIEIERDWVKIEGQVIYRPERVILGDWLLFWDAAVSPVNYQEAFEAGVESVESIRDTERERIYDEGYDAGYRDKEYEQ
jgi:hypothetical protein